MRQRAVLVAMLWCAGSGGCGGATVGQAQQAQPPKPDRLGDSIARLIAVTERGDVAATRALLADAVGFGGLWFNETACRVQLSTAGTLQGARVDVLAGCLAALRLSKSERVSPYPDIAVLTYEPGIEIEVLFGGERGAPQIRWIGYVSRRSLKDALPTITQRALEARRIEGALDFDEATRGKLAAELAERQVPVGSTWLKVCLDAGGAVTQVHPRETSSLALQDALVAAISRWKFQPVLLGGQPTPVCSLVQYGYPAGAPPAKLLPFPVPPGYESVLIVRTSMLKRLAGGTTITPDDKAKDELDRRRINRVVGSFFYCITPEGKVDIVVTLRATEVPRYDDQIRAAIRGWRFAPVRFGGRSSPACSTLTFIYGQR